MDVVKLGGLVELSGFGQIKRSNNVVINKLIGNYTRHFSDAGVNFEKLHINLKPIHGKKIEVHAKAIDNGDVFTSKATEYNLYVALDSVLKKIKASMRKK